MNKEAAGFCETLVPYNLSVGYYQSTRTSYRTTVVTFNSSVRNAADKSHKIQLQQR